MKIDLLLGDSLEIIKSIPDNSIDLVLTDPPYFKVKNDLWDRQWGKPNQFLEWLDLYIEQYVRVLKPNGSLYLFASPQMGSRVECLIAGRLNILNRITWVKKEGRHKGTCKESLRSYFSQTETIVFAEHYGADNIAKCQAGYEAKCDELRGFVFEPIRAYLDSEWKRAGLNRKDANEATKTQMCRHYFSQSQWTLPTLEKYEQLQAYANSRKSDRGGYLSRNFEYLKRDYEELKSQYDILKLEFDSLRRPFLVTANVPYTDVWDFDTVSFYKGKHPCEKPQALLKHIIRASSKPGSVVLDTFMGTGSTGIACRELGRSFIGIEKDPGYFEAAKSRIEKIE